jgi:phage gp37-like protein
MLAELAQDLVDKLKTVSGLESRVGLAVGGREGDPLMTKVALPAAWVVYRGDEAIDDTTRGRCVATVRTTFIVKVLVEYKSGLDLTSVQFPLVESIIKTINGTKPTGLLTTTGWKYEGQTIDEIETNRLVYDQIYTTTISL